MRSRREQLCIAGMLVAVLLAVSERVAAQPAAEQAIQRARAVLRDNPAAVHGGPNQAYVVRDVSLDSNGGSHVRFDRTLRGLRVLGGDFVLHHDANGSFRGVSMTLARVPAVVSLRPTLDAAGAARAASQAFGPGGTVDTVELVIEASTDASLAYDVVVTGRMADDTPSERHFVVDARSGQVLDSWDSVQTAEAPNGRGHGFLNGDVVLTTDSVGASFELRDPSRGNQSTNDMQNGTTGLGAVFTSGFNEWGNNLLNDPQSVGVDAQYGAAQTWDYYKLVHARNGIRNDGRGALSRVHYGVAYANAFWSDSCFCMTYGDGDNLIFLPLASLDVAGHEMTHGITSATAALRYSGESGGLNEATSDIFGTMVEFRANNPLDSPDYLIGEHIMALPEVYLALRSMYRPDMDGVSPNCYNGFVKSLDVHYSSGIANHFFYLLAEGSGVGQFTDAVGSPTCDGRTLTGIGRDKAERIWYRALTTYMTSRTNYSGARTATLNAALDLGYGPNSAEYQAVAGAWKAVNVGESSPKGSKGRGSAALR